MQKVCFGSVLGYILEAKSIKKRFKIDSEKNIEQTSKKGPLTQKESIHRRDTRDPPYFDFH